MVRKMLFLWVCECGQEWSERPHTTVQMQGLRTPFDTGTAAGIYDLRRLKIKLCAEPVGEARSALDFAFPSPKMSTLDFSTHFITQNVQVTTFWVGNNMTAKTGYGRQKTWERYVLRNRPCMALYGRLPGTYCSQVATRTPTWERHPFRTDCQSIF